MTRAQSVRVVHALPRVHTPAQVHAMLQHFDTGVRPRVGLLAASNPYFEDLMWAFPGALHAMARAPSNNAAATAAKALVRSGAPLRSIAARLGLPMWLRRFAPEAFSGPPPSLPLSHEFASLIGNHFPDKRSDECRWLKFIAAAHAAGDETFAVWTARSFARFSYSTKPEDIRGLGVWAWFGRRPELAASKFIHTGLTAAMAPNEAATHAHTYFERLLFPIHGRPARVREASIQFVDGFEFVRLDTPQDFFEEAATLKNCLDTYAEAVAAGEAEVWSVRHHGARVAALEFPPPRPERIPELVQLRGPSNMPVSSAILHAVYRWLLMWPEHDRPHAGEPRRRPDAAVDAYRQLMKPYWLEKGLVPWLPLNPNGDCFGNLRCGLWRIRDGTRRRRRNRYQRE